MRLYDRVLSAAQHGAAGANWIFIGKARRGCGQCPFALIRTRIFSAGATLRPFRVRALKCFWLGADMCRCFSDVRAAAFEKCSLVARALGSSFGVKFCGNEFGLTWAALVR